MAAGKKKKTLAAATTKTKALSVKKPIPRYKFPYEKEDDLMAMFKAKEYLYNQSLTDYYNKPKKDRCYQAIAKRLNVTGMLFILTQVI